MPIALKDNIETAGVRTTSGAAYLADHIPNSDAPVVGRLKAQGAVLIGKANMQELAWGVVSTNPVVGQCRNPWNPERIPGGSSGGSGAVVAAEMAEAALGTDTGGSVTDSGFDDRRRRLAARPMGASRSAASRP